MTITESPNQNPGPAPFEYRSPPRSRWTLPVLVCLASLVFCVAAGLAACEVDEVAEGITSEEIDSQDDASIRSCDHDESTGAVTAAITVTNDSSGLSSYIVEVEFTDGDGSRVGGSYTFLDEVEPDATEEREVGRDVDDRSDVTCRIDHVERFAA
jgi:hypothetical protein